MKFILEKSRYLAIVGVISLLAAAVAAFAWGTFKTVRTVMLVFESMGSDAGITIEFIEIIDKQFDQLMQAGVLGNDRFQGDHQYPW